MSIVTTAAAGRHAGLTVSSMCSVCAEPALLLVCVNLDNQFIELADDSQRFVVNILSPRHQTLAMTFAGLEADGQLSPPEADRFDHGHWTTTPDGLPVLADALVSLECQVESSVPRGTHRVFFGLVQAVATGTGEPLVYADRQFATLAPLS